MWTEPACRPTARHSPDSLDLSPNSFAEMFRNAPAQRTRIPTCGYRAGARRDRVALVVRAVVDGRNPVVAHRRADALEQFERPELRHRVVDDLAFRLARLRGRGPESSPKRRRNSRPRRRPRRRRGRDRARSAPRKSPARSPRDGPPEVDVHPRLLRLQVPFELRHDTTTRGALDVVEVHDSRVAVLRVVRGRGREARDERERAHSGVLCASRAVRRGMNARRGYNASARLLGLLERGAAAP